jgi:hypothetical protein
MTQAVIQYVLVGVVVWAGLSALCRMFWEWFFRRGLGRAASNYVSLPTWPGVLMLPLLTVPFLLFEFPPWLRQRSTMRRELREMRQEAEALLVRVHAVAQEAPGSSSDELHRSARFLEAEIAKIDQRLERL